MTSVVSARPRHGAPKFLISDLTIIINTFSYIMLFWFEEKKKKGKEEGEEEEIGIFADFIPAPPRPVGTRPDLSW